MADIWVPLRAGTDIVVPRRAGQLRPRPTTSSSATTSSPTPTRRRSSTRTSADPRISTACSRAGTRTTAETLRHDDLAVRMGATQRGRRAARPDASASALRLSDPEAPLRALHAGDGRAGLRRAARRVPARSPTRSAARPDPERTAPSATRSAGRSIRSGVQIIRTAAILQLLLGNIGRPGGGILALRGHASIQGSTDIPTLYDILPGYLPMPTFGAPTRHARPVTSRSTARTPAGGRTSTSTSSRC